MPGGIPGQGPSRKEIECLILSVIVENINSQWGNGLVNAHAGKPINSVVNGMIDNQKFSSLMLKYGEISGLDCHVLDGFNRPGGGNEKIYSCLFSLQEMDSQKILESAQALTY